MEGKQHYIKSYLSCYGFTYQRRKKLIVYNMYIFGYYYSPCFLKQIILTPCWIKSFQNITNSIVLAVPLSME